jgi:hypothetical protein
MIKLRLGVGVPFKSNIDGQAGSCEEEISDFGFKSKE